MSYREEDPRRASMRRQLEDEFELDRAASVDTEGFATPALPRSVLLSLANIAPGSAGATTLAALTDVNIPSPTDEQVLRYNFTDSMWEAESLTSLVSEYDDDDVDAHLDSLAADDWRDYGDFEDAVTDTLGDGWTWVDQLSALNRAALTAASAWLDLFTSAIRSTLITAAGWLATFTSAIRGALTTAAAWLATFTSVRFAEHLSPQPRGLERSLP